MKIFWKRFIAVLLCTVMIVTLLPNDMFGRTGASAASLLENSPEYNQEILDALSGIVGSEDAEEYYQLLQQYGLIDEDGNVLDDWDIELDGKKSAKLKVGDTFKLKADLKLEDDKKKMVTKSKVAKVRYISSDTSVAKVDANGNITAVGKGSCNIYAYSRNGAFAKIKIKVK